MGGTENKLKTIPYTCVNLIQDVLTKRAINRYSKVDCHPRLDKFPF